LFHNAGGVEARGKAGGEPGTVFALIKGRISNEEGDYGIQED
jgi:hypothetical protein